MKNIDIHQGNVKGLGAIKFSEALIKDILKSDKISIQNFYYHELNFKFEYSKASKRSINISYLLGTLSRIFEILFWKFYREQNSDIFILGDLPVNTRSKQYVFCQQSLMFNKFPFFSKNFLKFRLFRIFFRLFLKTDDVVLVQSSEMQNYIKLFIGEQVNVKILDLTSSSFGWPEFYRNERSKCQKQKSDINLIYPAAFYPHKNHHLLSLIENEDQVNVFTTVEEHEIEKNESTSTLGRLSRSQIFEFYRDIDGLIFLSSNESLGMPILEAIKCNLPIVCPHAEYTKNLDGLNCIFFDLDEPESLKIALLELRGKLLSGWWPSWNFNKLFKHPEFHPIENILLDQD